MGGYVFKGRIIDGNGGKPIERGVVAVENGRISAVCREGEFRTDARLTEISMPDAAIMPGFIDCHTHLTSIGMMPEKLFLRPKYDMLLEAVGDAKKLLEAGFTSAREMGEFGPYLKRAIARGSIPGPKLFVSSRLLSSTSGHGDTCSLIPLEYVQEHNTIAYLVDGMDECLKGARLMFREGADFIKSCSTGGIMSYGDEPDTSEFSLEELRAMVEEAERHNTYVATHSQGTKGILKALRAGVKSIEHGIFLDEECVELMVKNDVTYDPTVSILRLILANPDEVPPYAYRKGRLAAERHVESVRMAREAGIRIVLGTDFLGGDSEATAFGKQGMEFVSLVEAGLTPMEAIVAGTKNGAHLIKKSAEVGTLEAGKIADIVLVDGDPLRDISILADAANIRLVMQDGIIKKNTVAIGEERRHG